MKVMRGTSRCLLVLPALLGALMLPAQVLEGVIVERYHVQEGGEGEEPLVTYRIFLDLAEGHDLEMVYGDDRHPLRIETSTYFHNHERGAKFAGAIQLNASDIALLHSDSWLTMGVAAEGYTGVPLDMDTDGSILECPTPVASAMKAERAAFDPLCVTDGLVPAAKTPEVVNFLLDPGYFGAMKGNVLQSTNGAWAVLGGLKGTTDGNIILIAQVCTSGALHFTLNAQIGTPDGGFVKVVHGDPAPGEVRSDALTFGVRPAH